MKTKQTIHVNGTDYDAVSGQVVATANPPLVRPLATSRSHQGKTVDGVFRTNVGQNLTAHASSAQKVTPSRPKTANHAKPHRTQTARTLMRRAVQPPSLGLKKQLNTQAQLRASQPAVVSVQPKASVTAVSPTRLARATSTSQSQHISHYATAQATTVPVTVAPLSVQSPPSAPPVSPEAQRTHRPLDIFEQAMQNATHYRPIPDHRAFKKKTRRHVSLLTAGSMSLLVLGGFLAYLNMPSIQFRAASLQAGIGASVPELRGSGLSLTGAHHSGNIVRASFSGTKGSGSYTVSEQSTNWDNAGMIAQIGVTDASGTPTYRTVQSGKQTVYRFSNTTATWIKGGIWYQLTSPQAISDTQLETLVASL